MFCFFFSNFFISYYYINMLLYKDPNPIPWLVNKKNPTCVTLISFIWYSILSYLIFYSNCFLLPCCVFWPFIFSTMALHLLAASPPIFSIFFKLVLFKICLVTKFFKNRRILSVCCFKLNASLVWWDAQIAVTLLQNKLKYANIISSYNMIFPIC